MSATPKGTTVPGLECVRDLARLGELADPWDALTARVRGTELFGTWDWAMASARWLHRGDALHCLVQWAEGRMVGVAPLVRRRRWGMPVVQFLGHGLADYGDVVVEEEFRSEFAELMAKALRRDNLLLRHVRADSPNRTLLERLVGGHSVSSAGSPYVRAGGPVSAYLGGPRKRLVQDGRRQVRRLEKLGHVHFGVVTSEVDLGPTLDALIGFKSVRTYALDVAVNPFVDLAHRGFLDDLCRRALRRGSLRLETLTLEGRPIAVHVGLIHGGTYYYYVPAFAAEFARYSPGRLLMQRAIESAFAAGLEEFDFLNGEEPYKYDWSTGEHETRTYVRLRPFLLTVGYCLWYGRLKPALRRRPHLFMFVRRLRTGKLR